MKEIKILNQKFQILLKIFMRKILKMILINIKKELFDDVSGFEEIENKL